MTSLETRTSNTRVIMHCHYTIDQFSANSTYFIVYIYIYISKVRTLDRFPNHYLPFISKSTLFSFPFVLSTLSSMNLPRKEVWIDLCWK